MTFAAAADHLEQLATRPLQPRRALLRELAARFREETLVLVSAQPFLENHRGHAVVDLQEYRRQLTLGNFEEAA